MNLPLLHILDSRPLEIAQKDPYANSVNIPLEELARRVYELPRKSETINVAGPSDLQEETIRELARIGYEGVAVEASPANAPPVGRLWTPNPYLEYSIGALKPGDALDLACGNGRDSVFLASLGWQVVGLDVLPDAVSSASCLAERYLPEENRPSFRTMDIRKQRPKKKFDLVVCFFYFEETLLAAIGENLKPGGHALIEVFTAINREKHGKPARAVPTRQLPSMLPHLEVVSYEEGWRQERHTARLHAVKH